MQERGPRPRGAGPERRRWRPSGRGEGRVGEAVGQAVAAERYTGNGTVGAELLRLAGSARAGRSALPGLQR